MFDKFKQVSQLAGMFGNMSKIKEEIELFKEKVEQITAEGEAGGGMVKVRVNGKFEVLSCTLSEEVFNLGDRELLQDMVVSAAHQARERARQQVEDETQKMAERVGLPAGMGLPFGS